MLLHSCCLQIGVASVAAFVQPSLAGMWSAQEVADVASSVPMAMVDQGTHYASFDNDEAVRKRADKAVSLAASGCLNRATQVLTSSGVAPTSEQTADKLEAMLCTRLL